MNISIKKKTIKSYSLNEMTQEETSALYKAVCKIVFGFSVKGLNSKDSEIIINIKNKLYDALYEEEEEEEEEDIVK